MDAMVAMAKAQARLGVAGKPVKEIDDSIN